jgi:hypothetical protein
MEKCRDFVPIEREQDVVSGEGFRFFSFLVVGCWRRKAEAK